MTGYHRIAESRGNVYMRQGADLTQIGRLLISQGLALGGCFSRINHAISPGLRSRGGVARRTGGRASGLTAIYGPSAYRIELVSIQKWPFFTIFRRRQPPSPRLRWSGGFGGRAASIRRRRTSPLSWLGDGRSTVSPRSRALMRGDQRLDLLFERLSENAQTQGICHLEE